MMPALATLDSGTPLQSAATGAGGSASGEGGLFGQILTAAMVPAEPSAAEASPVGEMAVMTDAAALSVPSVADDSAAAAAPALDESALASLLSLAEGALSVLPQTPVAVTSELPASRGDAPTVNDDQAADLLLALPAGAMPQPLLPVRVPGASESAPASAAAAAGAVAVALPDALASRRAQIVANPPLASVPPAGMEEGAGQVRASVLPLARPSQPLDAGRQAAPLPGMGHLPLPAAFTAMAPALAAQPLADWQMPGGEGDILTLATAVDSGVTPSLPSQATAVASLTSGRAAPTLLAIPQHVQDAGWADAFSQRLVLLAQQGTQSASLQLNPLDLGPIQVKVSVTDQVANIEFAARHASTGELIESALPRLAHALDLQGIRLDDVRVSQLPARADSFALATHSQPGGGDGRGQAGQSGQAPGQQPQSAQQARGQDEALGREPGQHPLPPRQADSGIDYYA